MLVIVVLVITIPLMIPSSQKGEIVIAGKLGAEPEIIMNLYKILIEEESDITVDIEPNLGKTDMVFNALQQGSIDIYPEFTGTVIVSLLDEQAESNEAEEVYAQARDGIKEAYNLELLEPMLFNNTYTVAVTEEFAEENNLEDISDLKSIENQVTAGFTSEFNDRYDGYVGMQEVYNLDFNEVNTRIQAFVREPFRAVR